MKRFLALFLAFIIAFTSLPIDTYAEVVDEIVTEQIGYEYETTENGVTLTSYVGEDVLVDIPETIGDANVTTIAAGTFADREDILGIEIPETVTTIAPGAFSECPNIEYISLPGALTGIEDGVFPVNDKCIYIVVRNTEADAYVTANSLTLKRRSVGDAVSEIGNSGAVTYRYNNYTNAMYVYGEGEMENYSSNTAMPWNAYKTNIKTLTIIDGVTGIGSNAFNGCTGITGELVIPESVTNIGYSSFYGCSGLTGLVLPGSITTLNSNTFRDCTGLTGEIVIPDSVATIQYGAFYNCNKVESLVIGSGVTTIGSNQNGASYMPFYYMSSVKSVTFKPETVPSRYYANTFETLNSLEKVYVPVAAFSAYQAAYKDYLNKASLLIIDSTDEFVISEDGVLQLYQGEGGDVIIPDEVTAIGPAAFNGKENVTSVTMGDNVASIGQRAFSMCTGLKNVTFGEGLETIEINAFNGCKALKGIVLPDSLVSIGNYAFDGCSSITGTITIPQNVSNIGNYAFNACTSLSDLIIEGAQGLTIGNYAFQSCGSLDSITFGNTESIGDYTFYNCDGLENLDFANVKTIGSNAFEGCNGLKSIDLSSVESIKYSAFNGCNGLTGTLVIPDSVTQMGGNVFSSCNGITDVVLSSSLTSIPYGAFYNCTGIEGTVVIPDSVTTIEYRAFYGCNKVEHLVMGSGVTTIGTYNNNENYMPFYGMSGVKTVTFKGLNVPSSLYKDIFTSMNSLEYVYVPAESFDEYQAAYVDYVNNARWMCSDNEDEYVVDEDGVLVLYQGDGGTINIPSTVTSIGASAFQGLDSITSVSIPDSVTSIGRRAFSGCSELKTLNFGKGITDIGKDAFRGCTSLKYMKLPNALMTVGDGAFYGCKNLIGTLTIPANVATIGAEAFYGCNALTDLVVEGVESGVSLGNYAFYNCTALETAVLGNAVSIGDYTFSQCTLLESLDLGRVERIGSYGFSNCSSLENIDFVDVKTIGNNSFESCVGLTNIDLSSVENIQASAFYNCYNLSGALVIPNTVTSIGSSAFNGCNKITGLVLSDQLTRIQVSTFYNCTGITGEIVIPDSVTTIEYRAFYGCNKVESLVVGSGVTTIGTYNNGETYAPFYGMSGVKRVTFKPEKVPSAAPVDIFCSMNNLEVVAVPSVAYNDYVAAYNGIINNGRIIMDAEEDLVIVDGVLLQYTGEATELDLTTIQDEITEIGTAAFKNNITLSKIVLQDSVTTIGNSAFYGCKSLTSVTLGANTKTINQYGFYNCTSLSSVNLKNVEVIGSNAFAECSSLEGELKIPATVKSINNQAFYNCKKLTSLNMDAVENEVVIGTYAFYNCSGLTKISLGTASCVGQYAFQNCTALADVDFGNVENIDYSAFNNCDALTELDFANVKTIGGSAFIECNSLKTIDLASVESIASSAFQNCNALTGTLTIPDSVTSLGASAFYGCSNITGLLLSNNLKTIAANTFYGCNGLTGEIVIPNSVTTIEYRAFYNCSKVESLVIGSGVTTIGSYRSEDNYMPFYGMSGVKTVTFLGETVPSRIHADIFCSMNSLETVTVPVASYSAYVAALSPYINNGRIIMEATGDFVIDENGVLLQYTGTEESVVIPETVVEIGQAVFQNNTAIKAVEFGANIVTVGQNAFSGCTNLSSVTLNDKLEEIGSRAFYNCIALTFIDLKKVVIIKDYAFYGCTALAGILEIPSTVTYIDRYAFNNCRSITNLDLQGSVEGVTVMDYAFAECSELLDVALGYTLKLGAYAFYNCTKLASLNLGTTETIGSHTFYNCDGLTEVDFKEVKTIGSNAFYDCNGLTSIDLKGVANINSGAFYYCNKLDGSLTIPDYVTYIGSSAFYGCSELDSILLSNSVNTIYYNTFGGCTGLSGELVIPDSVKTIEYRAFQNCNKVESLVFGTGIATIGTYNSSESYMPFYGMSNVKTVTFKGVTPPYTLNSDIFSSMNKLETVYVPKAGYVAYANKFRYYLNNGVIRVSDSKEEFIVEDGILYKYQGTDTEVVIPDGVTEIASSAFQNNKTITKVTMNKELTVIRPYAFSACSALTEVEFNDGLETLEHNAFSACTSLDNVVFPNSLVTIGNSVFYGCSAISNEIVIPANAENIGIQAFYQCSKISGLNLIGSESKGVTIGNSAFEYCSVLEKISLGNTESLGDYVFRYCTSLVDLDLGNVETIGYQTFYGCTDLTELDLKSVNTIGTNAFYNCNKIAGTLMIPNSVISLGSGAFYGCSSLEGLVLSENLKTIPANAFQGCTGLSGDLVIPDSVQTIEYRAFYNCGKIESIQFGNGISTIGTYNSSESYMPFYGMSGVRYVTFVNKVPPYTMNTDLFTSMNGLLNVTVPLDGYKAYAAKFRAYINHAQFAIADMTDDFVIEDNILYLYQGNDTKVTIPDGVEIIYSGAFQNNKTLEEVTFNEEVTKVEAYAFSGCNSLRTVNFNDKLETIGNRAFENCGVLKELNLNSHLESIGKYAFYGCNGFSGTLKIPSSVKTIDEYAFYQNNGITGLEITGHEKGTSIGNYAFSRCTELTKVELGNIKLIGDYAFQQSNAITFLSLGETEAIGGYAFDGCSSIQGTLIIPDTVTTMGSYTFQNCSGITGIELSKEMTSIPYGAFYNCMGLTGELVISDNIETINDSAFRNCYNVESIVLSSNLTAIGSYNSVGNIPFYEMRGVKEVLFRGSKVPSCGYADIFYSMNGLQTIYVPAESKDAYQNKFGSYLNGAELSSDTLRYEVKNFQASNIYSSAVKLTWVPHQNEKVIGYVILRDGEEVGVAKNCYFIDYDLTEGTEYTYSVYGVTEENTQTSAAEIKVTPKAMTFTEITTGHTGNSLAVTDGNIYIYAEKNANYEDLDGKPVAGKLYYYNGDGKKILIGESSLSVKDTLRFTVNWDVSDMKEGDYDVIFEFMDSVGYESVIRGTVFVDKTPPEKIVNLVAVGELENILLSWSKSAEVDSNIYRIYRKSELDSDFTLLTIIRNRDTLSYTDTSAKKDRLYEYYIVTENSFGMVSEDSDIAKATRAIDTEAPVITTMSPVTATRIKGVTKITITAQDNLQTTEAKFYYSTDEETWTLFDEDNTAPFQADFDTKTLTDGEIFVKAHAYDAKGNESEGKKVKYQIDNTGPEAVTGLEATTILASKLTLEWNDVEAGDVQSFTLEEKDKNGNWKVIAYNIKTLGYNLDNLKPSTAYTYRVAAVDDLYNTGEYSKEYSVTTAGDTIAPTITSLTPAASRRNSTISFRAAAGDDCGIKSITIQTSRDLKEWTDLSSAAFATANKTAAYTFQVPIDDFSDGSLYVRAVAEDYSGNLSDTTESAAFVEYMLDRSAPNTPRDLLACGGDGYIYLSWLQGDEQDLSTYSIFRSTKKDSEFIMIASGLSKVSYYDTTAERDVVYYYKIAVRDTVGNISEFSETVSGKVAEDIEAPEVVSINPSNNSSIGPEYHTVEALVKDNNCLDNVTFEYKVNESANYSVLDTINNIGYYYKTVRTDIPVEDLKDGDKVHIRVYCTDICGYTSEYSTEYTYHMDTVAPSLNSLKADIKDANVTLTWKDNADSDLAGFKLYRINSAGQETGIGSRSKNSSHNYQFIDYVGSYGTADYTYKIVAFDEVGNRYSYLSDVVCYEKPDTSTPIHENEAPKPVINGMETVEVGVEEFFDASGSTDDSGKIVSYLWEFGDGTVSREVRAIKRYRKTGTYTVKLTVTDEEGLTSFVSYAVTVTERTKVGTVNVTVVDENGSPIPYAPVYYNMGTNQQKVVYADASGMATYKLEHNESGESLVGCYKSGYLPATKSVKILPNATRYVTLTIIEEELVTGKFEVTRMTFNEIKAAGIDIYDPANQNVYSVRVTIKYGDAEVPIDYIRNDNKILKYTVGDSGGTGGTGGGNGTSSGSSSSNNRVIAGVAFVPNEENIEIIAVLDMNMAASTLKEFFDVKLHIVNNAESKFLLKDNQVDLNIPDGLTMMTGLIGEWNESTHVEFDKLYGQETETLSWVLRGDKIGEYDLSADYSSTLDLFNVPVDATFETDEPIKVYGMKDFVFEIQPNETIRNNAFYFNIGLRNEGNIDYYCPQLDYDGIVSNITASTLQKEKGESEKEADDTDGNPIVEEEDFDVKANLLNVRYVAADGTSEYVNYKKEAGGQITLDIDTLPPGAIIYYEYVAYNMINYDGIGYFNDACYEVLEGIGGGVLIDPINMDLFSTKDADEKLSDMLKMKDKKEAVQYLTEQSNYIYVANSDIAEGLGAQIYDRLKLVLTLDFNVLTKDDKKEIIDQLLVEMITDASVYDNIDDMVDTQYINTVKNILDCMKDIEDIDKAMSADQIEKWTRLVTDTMKNEETVQKLAQNVATLQGDELQRAFYVDMGVEVFVGISMTTFKASVQNYLSMTPDSPLMKGLAGVGKYGGMVVEMGLLNPIMAYNDTMATSYLYALLQMHACREEAILLLNTVIEFNDDSAGKKLLEFVGESVRSQFDPLYKLTKTDFKDLIVGEAKKLKKQVLENSHNEFLSFAGNFAKYTAQSIGKIAMEKIIEKALGKLNIWYALLGAAFKIGDRAFGLGEKYKTADAYAIAAYISLSVTNGYSLFAESYGKQGNYAAIEDSYICDNLAEEDVKLNDSTVALYALYEMKYLCKIRLLGEQVFKKFVGKDNTTLFQSDEEYDEKVEKRLNEMFGTSGKDIEEIFDIVYQSILKRRDLLFNKEATIDLEKPIAPVVKLDYEKLCTVDSYSDDYEYCYADGEWRSCDGEPIPFTPKTHSTVLRVRRKSVSKSLAGEITTVNVFAKKELSKTISAKYEDGTYYFKNLNANYTYEAIPVTSFEDEPEDWSTAKKMVGGYSASIKAEESDYIALRALQNDELREMTSATAIYKVAQKEVLSVIVEGNGSVTQSAADARYYSGEDAVVTAIPDDDSKFVGWYINGDLVSQDTTYYLDMFPNAEIFAKFDDGTIVNPESVTIVLPEDAVRASMYRMIAAPMTFSLMTLSEDTGIPDITLYEGERKKLSVSILPENATNKSVTWVSSDEDIVTISRNGILHCVNPGTATITATTTNGVTTSFVVEVLENAVTQLVILRQPSKKNYFEGESFDDDGLKVLAKYADGTAKVVSDYDLSGYDAANAGDKTVTITYDGVTTSFTVLVKHDYHWNVMEESTCEKAGYKQRVCGICGDVDETKVELPLAGHSYEWTFEEREGEDGTSIEKMNKCIVCGDVCERIPVESHTHDYVITEKVKPDCENDGYTVYTCSVEDCKKSYRVEPVLVDQKQEVTAPKPYPESPHNYPNGTSEYTYTYEKADSLAVTFHTSTFFETNCDKLHIYDGNGTLIGSYTGGSLSGATITIPGNIVKLRITTDGSVTYYGFAITNIVATIPYSYENSELLATGHNYEEKLVEATCNSQGYTLHKCKNEGCGDSYADNVTAKTEHNILFRTVQPTCDHEGYDESYCENCDYSEKSNFTAKVAHSYIPETVEATCEHGSGTKYKCENCGAFYVIDDENTALGHKYETKVVEPTCEENGYTIYTCSECGDSYRSDSTQKTGHSYGDWLVRTPSTEDMKGVMYRICILCNEEEVKYIDKADHVHVEGEWYVEKEAECEKYGIKAVKCTKCKEIVGTNSIAPLGHEYSSTVIEATCTKDGYTEHRCGKCDDVYCDSEVKALGHIEGEWETGLEPTCTNSGYDIVKCTKCSSELDRERVDATGHKETMVPAVAANCEKSGLTAGTECSVCRKVMTAQEVIPAIGHSMGSWSIAKDADCTTSGLKVRRCTNSDCTKEETTLINPKGHKPKSIGVVAPACEATGLSEGSICSVCNSVLAEQKVVPATGHSYGEYALINAPNAVTEGLETRTCHCGATDSRKIARLKATIKLSATKLPLQIKKSTMALKVISMTEGDKVVSFTSSNKKIVTVNSKTGKITAKKKTGKATITVTLLSGITAKCVVTVQKRKVTTKTIKLSAKKLTLKKGKIAKLIATLNPLTSQDKVTFVSANKKIATVTNKGVVKAKKKGKVKITAKSGKKKVTCTVTVK